MLKLVTVTVNLGSMALMRTVIHAAVDVLATHVIQSLVHATVTLGGMETNVTLKSVSQSVSYVRFLI